MPQFPSRPAGRSGNGCRNPGPALQRRFEKGNAQEMQSCGSRPDAGEISMQAAEDPEMGLLVNK
jgi:hypothetical protein